jgi:uncharacterized protein (TIGR02147 family)
MQNDSVFEFTDFKDYLAQRFSTQGASRGMRINFANQIHASPSYVTKILSGKIKLGLEHVPVINRLLGHTEQESKFFMQLVLYTQAGSKDLERHFKRELDLILQERKRAAEWIPDKNEHPREIQAKFHSAWYYGIMHVMTSIPAFQTKEAIAERLRLSMSTVESSLNYLISVGKVEKRGERYINVKRRVHHDLSSDWILHDHMNMRQLSVQKLIDSDPDDIRYWLAIALSFKDSELIKKKLRKMIYELEPLMVSNKNEELCVLIVDYFKI